MDDAKLKRKLTAIQREAHETASHRQSLMISVKHFDKWQNWKEAVDFVVEKIRSSIK